MKTTKFYSILVMLMIALCATVSFSSCSSDSDGGGSDASSVIGTWVDSNGYEVTMKNGKVYQNDVEIATYTISGNDITFVFKGVDEAITYKFKVENSTLTILDAETGIVINTYSKKGNNTSGSTSIAGTWQFVETSGSSKHTWTWVFGNDGKFSFTGTEEKNGKVESNDAISGTYTVTGDYVVLNVNGQRMNLKYVLKGNNLTLWPDGEEDDPMVLTKK